MSESETG